MQRTPRDFNLILRHRGDAAAAIAAVRARMLDLDPAQPLFGVATMEQLVSTSAPIRQMTMVILGLFSALAMVLSAIGIYGVMAYSAARRTREIGIRMALGAQSSEVMGMMMGSGMKMAALGTLAGVLAAVGAARLLKSLLYGTASTDPVTYASATALLLAVALLACYLPARRAMRVDPLTALREE
jgi:ABC-type antimicrobial peptide transport system permease subunit